MPAVRRAWSAICRTLVILLPIVLGLALLNAWMQHRQDETDQRIQRETCVRVDVSLGYTAAEAQARCADGIDTP